MTHDDSTTAPTVVEWRLTGVRRWLPVVVLACFGLNGLLRLVEVLTDDQATIGTYVQLAVSVLGTLAAGVMVVLTWRARVRLLPTGIEVRRGRRRFVAYDHVTRVYRDRFTAGGATLLLEGDSKVLLPAPLAGLGVGSPEVDDAVEQIRLRLPTSG